MKILLAIVFAFIIVCNCMAQRQNKDSLRVRIEIIHFPVGND